MGVSTTQSLYMKLGCLSTKIMTNLELNCQRYLKLSINDDLYEQACQCKFFLLVKISANIWLHLYFPRTHDTQNMKIVRCKTEINMKYCYFYNYYL